MKNITRDEIKDAMQRYIADGGKIEKIKFKDNGMLLNNDFMLVTDDTSQSPIGWLKAVAPLNKDCILVTDDTSQLPMGWLNTVAL